MRHKDLVTTVLWSLVVLPACLATNDAQLASFLNKLPIPTTESSDYDLNLDPDMTDFTVATKAPEVAERFITDDIVKCTTENGESGVCVRYYLCDQDSKTVIEDGYTIIDIRSGGPCAQLLYVCCKRNKLKADQKKEEVDRNEAQAENDVSLQPEVTQAALSRKFTNGSCGRSNRGVGVLRMSDGETRENKVEADFGEFPWMVALLKRKNNEVWDKKDYLGGGTLIHPSVVMTAAHKVHGLNAESIKIRVGEWDTNSMNEEYLHQERDVSKIIEHPDYYRPSLYNDITLLILKTPVQLERAPHIAVACLGKQLPAPGTKCFSMGWGADDFNNKSVYAAVLKKVKLPLVSSTDCTEMLRATRLGSIYRLHESLTCAGGQANVDTCRGDGGSSLVCPLNDGQTHYAVYGMVAYGITCGTENIPGVYVNVPHVYDWIVQQFAKERLDHSSFVI